MLNSQDSQDIDDVLDEVENSGANGRSETSLPEAPASINIKFWVEDFGVLLTMRSDKVSDVIKQMEYVLDLAKKRGWKSTWEKIPPAPVTAGTTPPQSATATGTAPYCSVHGRPMKLFNGKYGSFWKCTAKLAEGEWCQEKVNIKK